MALDTRHPVDDTGLTAETKIMIAAGVVVGLVILYTILKDKGAIPSPAASVAPVTVNVGAAVAEAAKEVVKAGAEAVAAVAGAS